MFIGFHGLLYVQKKHDLTELAFVVCRLHTPHYKRDLWKVFQELKIQDYKKIDVRSQLWEICKGDTRGKKVTNVIFE